MWSVIPQSDNTNLVRFVFDDPFAAAGMDVASYLLVRAFIGKEKPDGTRAAVIRPYTPSHTTIGYLELVVKGYPEGKMSKHINSLKPGDKLDFKGPILGIPIIQNEFDSIGLIAGGSGITPMLQVRRATTLPFANSSPLLASLLFSSRFTHHARSAPNACLCAVCSLRPSSIFCLCPEQVAQRVLANPDDQTKVSLIFANVEEKDILLREKIEELQKEHPDQV